MKEKDKTKNKLLKKLLGKNLLLLVVAILLATFSTFAWFTLGDAKINDLDNGVIKYPNGVSIKFENSGKPIDGNYIKISNLIPNTGSAFTVTITKPADQKLFFSLKFAGLKTNPADKNTIFKMFFIKHTILGTGDNAYSRNMQEILNDSQFPGYFLMNYEVAGTETEIKFVFDIYFDNYFLPDGSDINEYQGVEVTIEKMEMEIVYPSGKS